MTRRTAKTRHSRRHNPHGIAAESLIAPYRPAAVLTDDTAELFLPGLFPALAR